MDAVVVEAAMRAGQRSGWTSSKSREVAVEFDRFVELTERYPHEALVPSEAVDQVWHELLDDARAAGRVPPHRPGIGPASGFDATLHRYELCFGPPGRHWARSADCQVDRPRPEPPPPQ